VCILTLNLFLSQASVVLGLARTPQSIEKLQKELLVDLPIDAKNPLAMWSEKVEALSMIP
jgi:hypothetical protein